MRTIPEHDLTTATWHKSSYSAGDGGNCLEVARNFSGGYPNATDSPNLVPVRDSKNPTGPKLVFRAQSWAEFIANLKAS